MDGRQPGRGALGAVTLLLSLAVGTASFQGQSPAAPSGTAAPADWNAVETALDRKGQTQGSVLKFGMPRSDLKVLIDGIQVKPTLALGSWVAFDSPGKDALMMGDLVLTGDEIAPVMASLRKSGINVLALHNHVVRESPQVLYMHVSAHGEAATIARQIRETLLLTGTPPHASTAAEQPAFDVPAIEKLMGFQGKVNGGVLQFSIPRSETIAEHGRRISAAMGLATAINFQPAGNGRAAVTGDFVLLAAEVTPVIDALTQNRVQVTALHSHMLEENPRLFFLHFWAVEDALTLARGLRAALEKTNSEKTMPQ